jgi:hypothetical protein
LILILRLLAKPVFLMISDLQNPPLGE